VLAKSESVGQKRMRDLHGGRSAFASVHDLEIVPNLWSGVRLVRGGAGTALVGSHNQVADGARRLPRSKHRRVHPVRLPASPRST
jgi:hypothetical protein